MGLFGSNHIVGIDFGYSNIKVVGLTNGRRPKVVGFTETAIDGGSLQKDGEAPEAAVHALKEALQTARPRAIKATDAYVSISEADVFRKIIEVPREVSDTELSSVVRAAVIEYLPEDIEHLELDYHPLPGKPEGERSIMVVAVSRKLIDKYLGLCKAAGLTVRAIDPKPSSLLRSVVGPKKTEPTVIVDIGSENSTISLCAEGAVWVASTVTMGGNIVKDMVTGTIDPDKKDEKLGRLVASLSDEIDHVIKFYTNRSTGGAVEVQEVRLTGGGSLIEGIEQVLAKENSYKFVFAKPPVEMPDGFTRQFMGALGSALYPWYDEL